MNIQISPEQVIAWATLAVSMIGAYFKLSARITSKYVELVTRLATIETKIDIFWRDVSFDAAKIIHHPDPRHERLDTLMELYTSEQIGGTELSELMEGLQQKIETATESKSERIAASVLLRAMQQRLDVLLKKGDTP